MNKKIIATIILIIIFILGIVVGVMIMREKCERYKTELEKTQVYARECFNKFPNDQRGFKTCYFYKIHPEYKIMKIEPSFGEGQIIPYSSLEKVKLMEDMGYQGITTPTGESWERITK